MGSYINDLTAKPSNPDLDCTGEAEAGIILKETINPQDSAIYLFVCLFVCL